ncbi:hypothetical protein, partial [Streptomyces sp. NPDC005093]
MNPYEGPVTVERTDGTLVRVWAEVAVAQEHPGRRGPPWTAQLTAPGGEALLLKGAVTLILSRTRWPAEVTHPQLSSGPHSANWTKIKGTGPATTRRTPSPAATPNAVTDHSPASRWRWRKRPPWWTETIAV